MVPERLVTAERLGRLRADGVRGFGTVRDSSLDLCLTTVVDGASRDTHRSSPSAGW
jgi:hypothetical protein